MVWGFEGEVENHGNNEVAMLELIIAFSLAVVISAVCSITEAAFYSIPISYLEAEVQHGSKTARILKQMREKPQAPIAAILILNTVANTAGAAVAGAAAIDALGHQWLGYFSAFFTFMILTFSEILPKTIGVAYCRKLGTIIAYPLRLLVLVLSPLIVFFNGLTKLVKSEGAMGASVDEIRAVVETSRESGQIDHDQETVIRNILDLKSKRAWDIMTPRTVVFMLDANLKLGEIMKQVDSWPYSRIPVYDENQEDVVGMVMRRDVFACLAKGKTELQLKTLMKPVHFVPHTVSADKLLMEFIDRRQHLFMVIDEYGQIDGVVTLEDVLEEIVGQEIVDELDTQADMQELARERRAEVIRLMKHNAGKDEPDESEPPE